MLQYHQLEYHQLGDLHNGQHIVGAQELAAMKVFHPNSELVVSNIGIRKEKPKAKSTQNYSSSYISFYAVDRSKIPKASQLLLP